MDDSNKTAVLIRLDAAKAMFVGVHPGYEYIDYEWDAQRTTLTTYMCRRDGARDWQGQYPLAAAVARVNPTDETFRGLKTGDVIALD